MEQAYDLDRGRIRMINIAIFLNGPPSCGKDYLADRLVESNRLGIHKYKFADTLKRMAHEISGLVDVAPDYFEKVKDEPNTRMPFSPEKGRNLTPREFYIELSEMILKPRFGKDFFGRVMRNRLIEAGDSGVIVFSDSGFLEEATPVIDHIGAENCIVFHIYANGCDFRADSRSYWEHPEVPSVTFTNGKGEASVIDFINRVNNFINRED